MNEERTRRRSIGLLAVLAVVPLPFNELLSWPMLGLCTAFVALWAVRWRQPRPMPSWLVNLLGFAYLPVLVADLAASGRQQPLTPVLHLLLFGLVVKLHALRREREYGQVLLIAFFLFAAAMATSVHPSIVLYLVLWSGLALATLARGAQRRGRTEAGAPAVSPPSVRRLAAGTVLASGVLALPLFALLPRTGAPMLEGAALARRGGETRVGLGEGVRLGEFGRIRENRDVVLRLAARPGMQGIEFMRFKAATYEVLQGDAWAVGEADWQPVIARSGPTLWLASGSAAAWTEMWLQPSSLAMLPLPERTLGVEVWRHRLERSRGGAVVVSPRPQRGLDLRLALAPAPVALARAPEDTGSLPALLQRRSGDPRFAELAAAVAGGRRGEEAARALERHLQTEFTYSLSPPGGPPGRRVEHFLFTARRGHCEYFATALVLLLRELDIPARLVTGYLGAEQHALQDYFVVRQERAHAWVEAWIPERGWLTLDPTPPGGRPRAAAGGWLATLREAWDVVVFRWDRSVLGYGLNDQVRGWLGLRERLAGLGSWWSADWLRFRGRDAAGPPEAATETASAFHPVGPGVGLAVAALVLGAGVLAWWIRRRRPGGATGLWLRLLQSGRRRGLRLASAAGPLRAAEQLRELDPRVDGELARLVTAYLAESFAGRTPSDGGLRALRKDLRAVRAAWRQAAAARSASGRSSAGDAPSATGS